MPDWTQSMDQTYEYYLVDPTSWMNKSRLETVTSATINFDNSAETLGSASFDVTENVGEAYIRTYLVTIQNGITEKFPISTNLVQTPDQKFDGRVTTTTLDAYTPLLELKENPPPLGYSIEKETNIMDIAYNLCFDNMRAPIVKATSDKTLYDDFVSNTDDTWLTFISDLIANAKFSFGLDELGRLIFVPDKDTASMQPVFTFDDSNSSILYPEVTLSQDLYGIPNAVEVIYSNGTGNYYYKAVNDDDDSPISTVNRGREIIYRENNPSVIGDPTADYIQDYAKALLREKSCLEYTLTYTHGYYPVRVGDCVRLDYKRAGLRNIKARITSQSIKCEPGCPVTETAVFTKQLWKG